VTAPTAPAPAPAKGQVANGKAQQVQRVRPFVAGSRRVDKATYDRTVTLTASTQDLPVYECDPNGFLSGGYLLVQCTTAGNSATVTFAADGPFNCIDSFQFNDVNNKPIMGPLGGHDLYVITKYGGYAFVDDAKLSPVYSATTGSGATGGSFAFILRIPIEIVHRDALGSLVNKSASATYDMSIRLSANATIYGTPPTAAGSIRVRIQQFGWMDPNATDMRGNPVAQNPPASQTTQLWSKQTYTVNAGAFNFRLNGIDSMLRNLHFELRDGSGVRSVGDADWPDPFQLTYETSQPVSRIRDVWRHQITEDYGYTAAVETANGRDYGLYPLPFNQDFTHKPGYETRLGYLPVSSATNIGTAGTIGGSGTHTLVALINKVVPAGGDPMALTGV
jgi:hypothetical protein